MGELLAFVVGELLLPILLETLAQMFLSLGVGAVAGTVSASLGRRDTVPAASALIGLLLIGAALGGLSLWLWPFRVTGLGPFPGASLIVSPLLNGLVMDTYGRWRRARGGAATHVASFWGGAAFAFGIALVRFLLVPGFPAMPLER